ncbi:hypothetical protein V1499_23045 (plasmid) [Neobacillus sp. SCS-31]|uniref:hypothetical protein n=1 Tax=Neobacillus oceani TaxID=3115292 RepID=UPI003905A696
MGKIVITPEQSKFAMELGQESPEAMMNYLVSQTINIEIEDNSELSKVYQEAFEKGFDSCLCFMEEVLREMRKKKDAASKGKDNKACS